MCCTCYTWVLSSTGQKRLVVGAPQSPNGVEPFCTTARIAAASLDVADVTVVRAVIPEAVVIVVVVVGSAVHGYRKRCSARHCILFSKVRGNEHSTSR